MSASVSYLHCRKCVASLPRGKSMRQYARAQVGLNKDGQFEVWCNRHDISVAVLTEELRKQLIVTPCEECAKGTSGHYH